MAMQLSGVIHTIFPKEQYGNYFEKVVFWLKSVGTRVQEYYALEMWHDDAELFIKKYKVGDAVNCDCVLHGKYWSKGGREGVINSIQVVGISKQ
jgi:hypothetical protein